MTLTRLSELSSLPSSISYSCTMPPLKLRLSQNIFLQFLARLPLSPVHWNVLLPGFAPLLLSKKCLSRTIMRAMNSAMCQELILAVSAKLAMVCPGSRNKACKGRGHLCPLHWAALTSIAPAPATATQNVPSDESAFQFIQQ